MSLTKTKPFVTNVSHYNANNISLHTQDWKWLRSLHVCMCTRTTEMIELLMCQIYLENVWLKSQNPGTVSTLRCLSLPFFHTCKRTLFPLKTPGSRSVIAAVNQSPRLISFGSTHFWVGVFFLLVFICSLAVVSGADYGEPKLPRSEIAKGKKKWIIASINMPFNAQKFKKKAHT